MEILLLGAETLHRHFSKWLCTVRRLRCCYLVHPDEGTEVTSHFKFTRYVHRAGDSNRIQLQVINVSVVSDVDNLQGHLYN